MLKWACQGLWAHKFQSQILGIQDRNKVQGKSLKHQSFAESFSEYSKDIIKVTKEFIAEPLKTGSKGVFLRLRRRNTPSKSSEFRAEGAKFGT